MTALITVPAVTFTKNNQVLSLLLIPFLLIIYIIIIVITIILIINNLLYYLFDFIFNFIIL